MAYPNPFAAVQVSHLPFNETWNIHYNWTGYLRSDTAAFQGSSYLQNDCAGETTDPEGMQCPLLDSYCNSPENIFKSGPSLAVCSICPNVTLQKARTSLSTTDLMNQTNHLDWPVTTQERMFELSSDVSTGLISYCALVPGCSDSGFCSAASLLNQDGQFSRQSVATCWANLCRFYNATVNPDFGGLGACLLWLIICPILTGV